MNENSGSEQGRGRLYDGSADVRAFPETELAAVPLRYLEATA